MITQVPLILYLVKSSLRDNDRKNSRITAFIELFRILLIRFAGSNKGKEF